MMSGVQSSTGIFLLPGGVVREDGRTLREAELRPLTGREEDWLASHPGTPSAPAVTYLLATCLIRLGDLPPSRELVRQLLIGDRDYLMLQLRRLALGEQVSAVLTCPSCESRMDVDFLVDDVPVDQRPQTATAYSVELPSESGWVRTVQFRLPTGADQEATLGLEPTRAVEVLLNLCLVENDSPPLGPDERAHVIDAIESFAPQIDLELDLTCPDCRHNFVAPFDTTAFFLDEVRQGGRQLLREVHSLAFYYHWSEADILGLTRARRRAYLSLLSDALRPD